MTLHPSSGLHLRKLYGSDIAPHVADIAAMRIAVFREWPYLYEGDADYEADYLHTYVRTDDAIAVVACDGERVVGASTGLPMRDEDAAFQAPLREAGVDVARVFYCGESVLLPEFRGKGVGHAFFDAREAHARALGGFAWTTFAAVDRSQDDPRKPPAYRGNEAFWRKRGYMRRDDLCMRLSWNEIGRGNSEHTLTFWLRPLECA